MDETFRGLMRGSWCYLPYTEGPCGWFRGIWHRGIPEGWNPTEPPDPEDENGTTPNP